jgi:MFS family permease
MAVSTVMPLVERDLGDLWLYGWAFSAFFLGDLIGIVVGGRSADRIHPVVPLLVGLSVFTAGLVVGGLAPSMPVLVLGRFLQGIGAGVGPAVAYVCVARGFPPEDRPRVFAIMSTAWVVPSLVAPLAASAVAESFGWRWVFLGLVPVTAVAAALAAVSIRTLTASSEQHHEAVPLARVAALVVGAALLLAGLSAGSVPLAFAGVAAGVTLALPALGRLLPPGTAHARPGLPAAVCIRGVLTFAFFSASAYVSLALTAVRGQSTLVAGAALAAGSVTWTAGAWTQARCYESWGPARLERTAGTVLVVGTLLMPVALFDAVPVALWFVATTVAGLGMGLGYAPLSSVALAGAEPGREGVASSSLQLNDVLGIALGTGVGGAIVGLGDRLAGGPAAGPDLRAPLVALFGLSALAAVVVALLAGRLTVRRSAPVPG